MISLFGKWCHPTNGFEIDALTLGRHLGRVWRFGGTLDTPYSVLQHSLFVAAMMEADGKPPRECLAGLLHDGHEFLLGDVPTAWKIGKDRALQEDVIDGCIYTALAVDCTTFERDAVKPYDLEALIVEGNLVAPLTLEFNPERFVNPELVAKRVELFRRFYTRDPVQAFLRNWNVEYFPRMFEAEFNRLKGSVA